MNARTRAVLFAAVVVVSVAVYFVAQRTPMPRGDHVADSPPPTDSDRARAADPSPRDVPAPPPASQRAPLPRAAPSFDSTAIDPNERERLRASIWSALGQDAPDSAPAPRPSAYVLPSSVPEPPGDSGKLEPSYIQDRVHHDFFPLALGCYNEALKATPGLTGEVVLHFVIVGDHKIGGIVESVDVLDRSTLRDPAMLECLRESFLDTRFPPPEEGGWVTVDYPIVFSPDDDDGGED